MTALTRQRAEEFLHREAALLDAWDLDAWLDLLTDDARYLVPPNELPDAEPDTALFIIADDMHRLRGRVKLLQSRDAHAEFPPSRTRRLVTNVRILESGAREAVVTANFAVYRFRRGGRAGVYVGRYLHRLAIDGERLRIAERRAILDSEELGSLGSVSFIL